MDHLTITDFLAGRLDDDNRFGEYVLSRGEPFSTGRAGKRILCAVQSKRRIIEDHRLIALPERHRKLITPDKVPDRCGRCWSGRGFEAWPCPTMRAIATEYADHPDFKEEWLA